MTVPAEMPAQNDIMESVIAKGDLAKLTPDERVRYYNEVCQSMGLNPLTQPFAYITLNNKLTLYATRACADQLRKVNGVSLEIVSREVVDDVLTVHVRARLPDGRVDEDLGSVYFPSTLKGEARANAELKGVTKAKRRATLSICGLGWLDETEIADIPAKAKRPPIPARNVMLPATGHDAETGEIAESVDDLTAAEWDLKLADAANEGTVALQDVWSEIPAEHRPTLKLALDRRHKITAANVDAEKSAVMSRAFIAFYMGDYAKDTQTLTTVEHGTYFLLLMYCWVHGSIPSEPAKRAKIAKLPLREWNKIAPTIDPYFDDDGRNKRATKEIEKADEARFKRKIAGRKGGFASGRSKAISQGKRSNAEAKLKHSYSEAESNAEAKPVDTLKQCVANQRSKIITTTTSVAAREVPPVENSGSNDAVLPAGFAEKAREALQQNLGKSHLVDALERKGKHR